MLRSGDQIGPYTLINKLGRGAFGTVWLSERRTTIATTTAALKIPLDDDVDLETIKHEANLWVRASGHPNVLPIIEANIYDEQVIIASEYAPDGSLESWLKKHGKAPTIEAAVEIISGVLAGLEHLHSRNIIHRDLKPANILFQGGTPRLADFGISRVLKSTSQSSIVAGTPAYMAPEAFDGKRNEQTDIWSVGVIFYHLLAGSLPFAQADITSLVGAILSRNPDPLPITVPLPLREIISCALTKDPKQRYKSVAEMRAALRNPPKTNPKSQYVSRSVNAIPISPVRPMPPTSFARMPQSSILKSLFIVAALLVAIFVGAGGMALFKSFKPTPEAKWEGNIDPRRQWQSTGFRVKKGETIQITASGSVTWDPNPNTVQGTVRPNGYGRASKVLDKPWEFPVQEAGTGALIMRIGDSTYPVGEGATISSHQDGTVEFMVNDRINYLFDNSGSFHVVVRKV